MKVANIMKCLVILSQILIFGVMLSFAGSNDKLFRKNNNSNKAINRIEGFVWDPNRRPVENVYVELQNELYSTLDRVQTSSSGRFSFIVARQGNYVIKVLANGTNYLDTAEPVEIITGPNSGSSDSVYLDIYLKYDKNKTNIGITGITEAIFVQNVPEEARKLYKNGIKDIDKNNSKGLAQIEQALEIFPNYYDALNTLGREYVQRKEYEKSFPYLVKSIDINQRSYSSFYALAYAAYQLNYLPEATEAARAATILQANSVNAQLLYGTILRLDKNYEEAEKILLQAKNLSKASPVAEISWQLALLYNKLDRNKEAADELDLYLKIRPDAANKKEIRDLISKLRK